jgi:hypothetical protein
MFICAHRACMGGKRNIAISCPDELGPVNTYFDGADTAIYPP